MSQKYFFNIAYTRKTFVILFTTGLLLLLLTSCTLKVVPKYDDKLYNDTEAFFKKADAMIELGKAVSPKTDDERALITKPDQHPSHVSAFESKYNELLLDSDVLILRAIVNEQGADSIGKAVQTKISALINESLPSNCTDLEQAQTAKTSLAAMNFVDLKCIIIKWKDQHGDQKLTQKKGILKKSNWEGRKLVIFDAILAIQKAEGFKKEK